MINKNEPDFKFNLVKLGLLYSNWASFFHLLFIFGLMSNTFSIAVSVFLIGTSLILYNQLTSQSFRQKKFFILVGHLTHILPLFIFLIYPAVWLWKPLIYTLMLYFAFMAGLGINPLWLYSNIYDNIRNINGEESKKYSYLVRGLRNRIIHKKKFFV